MRWPLFIVTLSLRLRANDPALRWFFTSLRCLVTLALPRPCRLDRLRLRIRSPTSPSLRFIRIDSAFTFSPANPRPRQSPPGKPANAGEGVAPVHGGYRCACFHCLPLRLNPFRPCRGQRRFHRDVRATLAPASCHSCCFRTRHSPHGPLRFILSAPVLFCPRRSGERTETNLHERKTSI